MVQLREVVVAGAGLTRFDIYDGNKGRPFKECDELGSAAILAALEEARMSIKEVQAAFCGKVYASTATGHNAISRIGMTGMPIVNLENACSSGGSAIRLAYEAIAREQYDVVLAFGAEEAPRGGMIKSTSWPMHERMMGFNVQPAAYAMGAVRYMAETGATEEDFSLVTVKNRRHGALNPYARFQKPVSLEEVTASRMIAKPLRLLHSCPLADGAGAVILCAEHKLKSKAKKVTVAAAVLTTGTYGHEYGGGSLKIKTPHQITLCMEKAWAMSGMGPGDIDVLQAYDTMSAGELWDIEKMDFCGKGEAPRLLREGYFDLGGKLPVNTDGGLLSRGHALGATGIAQVIEIFRQIRGEAGKRQVPGAKAGLAHAMGAGPNSSVVILKR
ncbi:MAG: thiolase family protein [Desulfobacteraceae bacterium]|nr:MAG: thiolase family protein [Desulfobacteraceae bacterium]